MAQTSIWTADPVWIADVLRAEGVNLVEYPEWQNRGHGDFKDIRVSWCITPDRTMPRPHPSPMAARICQGRSHSCTLRATAR